MPSLKQIIEDSDTRAGRAFDLSIQALIVLSLAAFSVGTLPGLPEIIETALEVFEICCILIFTVEYLARIAVADKKLSFVFSFFGLIDLLAILPFYLMTGLDLRAVRAFRLLRLVRVLKLARYSAAARRFHKAFLLAREELILFVLVASIMLYLTAVGIYYFEHEAQPEAFQSVFHSLWWAVATLTTVGYGDVYPITAGGRIFTAFVLFVGLGIVAIPAGMVATALSRARTIEDDPQKSE
ncbi:MAG: ion transporter [Chromatiales bacterium]|nr:ion transporter [Chromatiales bacterium]